MSRIFCEAPRFRLAPAELGVGVLVLVEQALGARRCLDTDREDKALELRDGAASVAVWGQVAEAVAEWVAWGRAVELYARQYACRLPASLRRQWAVDREGMLASLEASCEVANPSSDSAIRSTGSKQIQASLERLQLLSLCPGPAA